MFLMLVTASFGSGLACLCGLAAIFYTQIRVVKVGQWVMTSAACICLMFLIYGFSPPSVKAYLEKRYEHRIVKADKDRLELWRYAMDSYLQNPLGVGFTLFVGGGNSKTFIHNDYLAYTVSYSVMGGVAYTSLIVGLMYSFIRRRKSLIDDPSALAVYLAGLGVIVVVAVNSITDNMLSSRWNFNLIWSLIWYSYFCSRAARKETIPEEEISNRFENRAGLLHPGGGRLLSNDSLKIQ
jgi:O-antigen ligase